MCVLISSNSYPAAATYSMLCIIIIRALCCLCFLSCDYVAHIFTWYMCMFTTMSKCGSDIFSASCRKSSKPEVIYFSIAHERSFGMHIATFECLRQDTPTSVRIRLKGGTASCTVVYRVFSINKLAQRANTNHQC